VLYALEGAVRRVRWHHLAQKDREVVKKKFEKLLSK
jgi:hypothetical protein